MKGKIEILISDLERLGKVTVLSDEETQAISERISEDMRMFRYDMARKQAQSIADTRKVILNA